MPQCTAKSKQSGQRCRRQATPGMSVCASHGSKSLRGANHPQFKTGRYAKAPERLLPRFQEAMQDRDLLALREDIAMLDARLGDLVGRVDTGETGHLYDKLRQAQNRVDDAHRRKDNAAVAEGLNEIRQLIRLGSGDHAAWEEIARLWEQRRRLVESERKRLVEMQQMIGADRALALLGAILDLIERKVPDVRTRKEILTEARRMITAPGVVR